MGAVPPEDRPDAGSGVVGSAEAGAEEPEVSDEAVPSGVVGEATGSVGTGSGGAVGGGEGSEGGGGGGITAGVGVLEGAGGGDGAAGGGAGWTGCVDGGG